MPTKRGRKRVNHPFELAREMIREESLESISQYIKWYALNRPSKIPKRPDRAYAKDWKGWPDFLGSSNTYPFIHKQCRSYIEAKRFAHSLKLPSIEAWKKYAKTSAKPADIPSRPDLFYRKTGEWYTWKDFLGTSTQAKIELLQSNLNICYIFKPVDAPFNVYRISTYSGSVESLVNLTKANNIKLLYMFNITDESKRMNIISSLVTRWSQGERNDYIVNNIAELITELSDTFEKLK